MNHRSTSTPDQSARRASLAEAPCNPAARSLVLAATILGFEHGVHRRCGDECCLAGWAGTLVDLYGSRQPLVLGPSLKIRVAPLTTTMMNALGPGLAGVASGVNNAVSRLASLLPMAFSGIVVSIAFSDELFRLMHRLRPALMQQVASQQNRLAAIETLQLRRRTKRF